MVTRQLQFKTNDVTIKWLPVIVVGENKEKENQMYCYVMKSEIEWKVLFMELPFIILPDQGVRGNWIP